MWQVWPEAHDWLGFTTLTQLVVAFQFCSKNLREMLFSVLLAAQEICSTSCLAIDFVLFAGFVKCAVESHTKVVHG